MSNRIVRGLVALVALTLLLPAGAAAESPPTTKTIALPSGRTLSVPVSGGRVSTDISQPGLLIPKGFPANELPTKVSDFPKVPRADGTGIAQPATYDTANTPGHWQTWRWGGQISPTPLRALIVLDRSDVSERPAVQDFVYSWTNFVRQRLINLGVASDRIPQVSYYQDSGNLGACPSTGTWTATNWNFTTVCTSWNMAVNCLGAQYAGCAWYPVGHSGGNAQPSVWIAAGINTWNARRNTAHHELGHTMGMPHNLSDLCSVMAPNVSTCDGWYFDKNLTPDDDRFLANAYNHSPD